jgi:hypothetical protein
MLSGQFIVILTASLKTSKPSLFSISRRFSAFLHPAFLHHWIHLNLSTSRA